MKRALLAVLLASLGVSIGAGQPTQAVGVPEIGIVDKLGQTIPLDAEFYDEDGNLVALKDLISKPTILTFVYYRCPGICTPLLTDVSRVVAKLDYDLGSDYQIVTISFDHRETPEMAKSKKENYLSSIARPVDPKGWRFLTGDSATIRRVTGAAGFYFKQDGNDWIHAGCLVVISQAGMISRYIYGIQFLPFDVKMALIEASDGKVSPTIAKVLQFCYSYDPEARTYALNVTRIAGAVILILVGVFVVFFIVKPKRRKREATNG